MPYANVVPATATGGATAHSFMNDNGWNGWGPALGYAPTTGNMNLFFPSNNALANALYANNNRISELLGLRRYYVADRNRNKLRSLLGLAGDRAAVSFEGEPRSHRRSLSDVDLRSAERQELGLSTSTARTLRRDWSASAYYTYEDQRSATAGNSYTANSNVAALTNGQPGAVGLSGNSCDGYTTLQQRNNNNKLDPCLNWSANMLDKVNTAGVAMSRQESVGKLDLTANLLFSRARWDNNVSGGNWANNILNGPGGAPTTIAAFSSRRRRCRRSASIRASRVSTAATRSRAPVGAARPTPTCT